MKRLYKLGICTLLIMSSLFLLMGAKPDKILKDLELFNKVVHLVESQYFTEVNFNEVMVGAIRGVMNTLDPHSSFLNEEQFQKMQKDTKGEFGGIGIEVSQKGKIIYIITAIEDTPAFKAGINSQDQIVEINHESTKGMRLDEAVEKMKGKPGEKLHLAIKREGEEKILHFDVLRKIIKIKPVRSDIIEEEFAFIRLKQFQKDSAKYIVENLKKIKKNSKIKGIIFDLRSNPGGLLDEAVNVSSIFLEGGIVVSTKARNKTNTDIKFVKKTGYKDTKTPLVVLVNGASASASEIVAGALQDHERAIIMGTQSFGKGSVQSVIQVEESYGLKLTVAEYLTPKKRRIQALGITPDILVKPLNIANLQDKSAEGIIKESDLKNHIKSAIKVNKNKRSKGEYLKKDYQVSQALNYLKSFKYFEKIKR